MSESRRSKRTGDDETRSTQSRSNSTPSSTSKRKPSKRSDLDRNGGFNPTSTSFSSTSQSPYPGMAAPSVASSYATANTTNPTNLPYQPPDLIRNPSINDQRGVPTSDTGRESGRKKDSGGKGDRSSDSDNTKASRRSERPAKDDKRPGSKRDEKPRRTDSERALDNHRASMVENQFPGEFPSTFAEPYRPPGLAADYYGDHGESVAFQPGVRPLPPSIIIAADQAHLHEATIEAAPPPEPSSLGQVGAAASFYGGTSDFESDPLPKPSQSGKRLSLKAAPESTGGASLRSSPGSKGRPRPVSYSATGAGPAAMAGPGIGAGASVGEAAEYFSTQFKPDLTEGGLNMAPSGKIAGQGMQNPTQGVENTTPGAIRPPFVAQGPSPGSNKPQYGFAAAGIAAVGAASYYAGHHTTEEHHSMDNVAAESYGSQTTGQFRPNPPEYQSQQPMQQGRRRRGPFSKVVDFFRDPSAVAEYEAYTEAIGVCKYCFEPGSSPRDAPRKHYYNPRYSDGRYGSSTRVDKLSRYQSSDDEKRRRSNGKKWVATGLAGYGLAKMSEAAANRRNDFGDNYSVKSGRPEASSRVSFATDERVSDSRRTKRSSGGDQTHSQEDLRRESGKRNRNDKRNGERYEERPSRRRDSNTSDKFSKGAAVSAGVAAAGLVAASSRRKRSTSPKKRYYSKRVSPNHSYVDLSATKSGAIGFGSFFSSPSANQRKGKKQKGLGFFNFTNASSSSSDADLAFGSGSVRRKRGRGYDRQDKDDGNPDAEILGLAATGVALAAEGDRQDRKGRRRADLMVVKETRYDGATRHDKKRILSPPQESENANDDWIDASDDESSVDSALAYGGRLSARQSRESFGSNDGTDKWAWRWNNGKKPRKKRSQDLSRFEPAAVGLAGAAIGAAAMSSRRHGPAESTASLQSLQQLDPIPMSDPNAINVDRKSSAISPMTGMSPSVLSASASSAQLKHPQPYTPISQAVYSSQASAPAPVNGPSGPPVFSQYPPQAPITESPKQMPVGLETRRPRADEKRRKRRNSSPTTYYNQDKEFDDTSRHGTSTQDNVKFDLTEEQTEKDRRAQARERRRSERKDRSDEKQADESNFQQEASLERERDDISSTRRSSADARTAREIEIERELERLYEEDRRQKEARKSKRSDTWPAAAAIGVGVAGVAAVAAAEITSGEKQSRPDTVEESKSEREVRRSRPKSALKQTTRSKTVDESRSDSQQRRIARMAAARVTSTSSPVHDEYASYFIPPELAEKVKEHNFAAEHRDDPIDEPAQIVEVAPRTARRKETFDPFLYRPFGIEPDDDPRRFAWPVPLLDIIEPTPPVSVRGDMSPLPSKSPELPEVSEEITEKKQKRSSSVTWGEHRTHEYEVITPLEDHEEFVRTATYESSQPAIDLAERTHSEVKPELSEPVTVSVRTNGVSNSSAEKDVPGPAPVAEEPPQRATYGRDLEFAAVLAAATESAGFDPSIVVDDPTYHRRDSPPGSESPGLYQSPFAETAPDLGTIRHYSVPPQRGLVEGEIIPTSANEASKQELDAEHGKDPTIPAGDEQNGVEPKVPGGFNVSDHLDDTTAEAAKAENTTGAEDPVIVSHNDGEEKRLEDKKRSPEVDLPPAESVKSEPIDWGTPKKLSQSSTFEEANFDMSIENSQPSVFSASGPEGFDDRKEPKINSPRNSDNKEEAVTAMAAATAIPIIDELTDSLTRRRKLEREEDDYYRNLPPLSASEPGADTLSSDSTKRRRKSKRDSDVWDDSKSVASSVAEPRDGRENGKRSKKSKRDSAVFDDDTMSVSSLPADLNGAKSSSRKSKDKKSAGFFGLFSSSKSDTSSNQKQPSKEIDLESRNRKATNPDDFDEPKRRSKKKSKDKDPDDTSSELQHSRSDPESSIKDVVRQQSPEEEYVSSEELAPDNGRTEDGMSFLGERPEMPTVLDGASGSITGTQPEAEQDVLVQPPTMLPDAISSTVRSRSVSPRTTAETADEVGAAQTEATSPSAQRDQFRQQHLAEIRTSDAVSGSLATGSPTAVPLYFRRLPVSPGVARSASVGSGSADSPMSPLVTPRTRQGRPTSTEFRNSKEFRPLYLVERHSSIKQPEPEVEETYPSLPSSRTSSAHPSLENLRGDDQGEFYAEGQMTMSQLRDRRHSFSYWRGDRPASPDYLDSRTATPTATEFPKEVKREKPKYEFHSPSELLEDPSGHLAESHEHQSPVWSPMVLPSVGSPDSSAVKEGSSTRVSRSSSPSRDQHSVNYNDSGPSIGRDLAAGATAALPVPQLIEHKDIVTVPTEQPPSMEDIQTVSHPSATPATPVKEMSISTGTPTSREIEVSSAPKVDEPEFALQPVASKKSKKERKKSRDTTDLADESVAVSSSSLNAGENLNNVDITGRLPVSEVNVRGMPSDLNASGFPQNPEHNVSDPQGFARAEGAEVVGNPDLTANSGLQERAVLEPVEERRGPSTAEEVKETASLDQEPSSIAVEEDVWAFSTKKSKKGKKQKAKQRDTASISPTPEPDSIATTLQETDTASHLPLTDKSTFSADRDLTKSEMPSLSVDEVETHMPSDKESMPAVPTQVFQPGGDSALSLDSTLGAFDDTDRYKGLSEMASRDSYPFDEPIIVPAVDTAMLSRPPALEEAFVKAEAARGTAPGVSEEEAFEAFRPDASVEPSFGFGRLDTIVEASRENSKVDVTQIQEAMKGAGEDQTVPSRSESKKDKEKSKLSRGGDAFDVGAGDATRDYVEDSTQGEAEITKDLAVTVEPVSTIQILDPSINPFGDDYVLPREDGIDDKSIGASRDLGNADTLNLGNASAPLIPNIPSASKDLDEAVEEFPWAPAPKKDKKKGRKGRPSALIGDNSTPVTEMLSTESVDQPEAKHLDSDSFAVSTKKGKKNRKLGQALDWTAEDESLRQKEVLEPLEQQTQEVAERDQDAAPEEKADDWSASGGKKAKKNRKKSQVIDRTDEAATPPTEESIDTPADSQRDASLTETELEDPTWATTKKSKKDKKRGKKSALPDKGPAETYVAPNEETVINPAVAEDQASALTDESKVPVAGATDEASLPRYDDLLPREPLSLALDGASLPREESSLPRDETSLPQDAVSPAQDEVYLPQQHLQPSELVESSQSQAPEVHDLEVPEAVSAGEVSGLQDIHERSMQRDLPQQAAELVEPRLPALDLGDADVASKVPESSQVQREMPEKDEDHEASALRDSRWASVFGELQQRNVLDSSNTPLQVPPTSESRKASTHPDPRWASVLGELKTRKASNPAREDQQLVPLPDVTQELQSSIRAGEDPEPLSTAEVEHEQKTPALVAIEEETNVLQGDTEPAVQSDLDPQERSLEDSPPTQVRPSAEELQAHEQAFHAALEGSIAQTISPSTPAIEDVRDRMLEQNPRIDQDLAANPMSLVESEWHDTTVAGDREISGHLLEPEILEGTQSEVQIQIDDPQRPETIAESSLAPTEAAEERADESLWAATERGEKDKKKPKSKPSTFEELAEPSSESVHSKDVLPTSFTAGAAGEPEVKTPPTATPADEPSIGADTFSWGPAKKTKKDKKKKKSLAFAEETPTPTGDDADQGQSPIPWPASLAHLASETAPEKPASEETQIAKDFSVEDEIQSQMEDTLNLPKKVEDSSSLALIPEQPISEETQVARDVGAEGEIQSHMEDMSSLPVLEEGHSLNSMMPKPPTSEEAQVAKDISAENELHSHRKDVSSLLRQDASHSFEPTMPEQQQHTVENDEILKANLNLNTARNFEKRGFMAEPETMQEEREDYSWAAAPKKKGKKNKKGRGSALETSGSATPQTEDEPLLAEVVEVPASAEIPEAEPTKEADWAFPTKTSKKDKKKRGSTLQISEPVTPHNEDESPVAVDAVIPAVGPQTEPAGEGESATSGKKGKRDKKKKKTAVSSLEDVAEPKPKEGSEATRDMSQSIEPEIEGQLVERLKADVSAAPVAEKEVIEQAVGLPARESLEAEGVENATERISITSVPEGQAKVDEVEPVGNGTQREGTHAVADSQATIDPVGGVRSAAERDIIDGLADSQALADSVEAQPVIASQSILEDESKIEQKPTATEDESSLTPEPEQSKKDKTDKKDKKKRKSTMVLDVVPEDSSSPANANDLETAEVVQDDSVVTDSAPISVSNRAADMETIPETTTPGPGMFMDAESMLEPTTIVESQRTANDNVSMQTEAVEQPQQPDLRAAVEPEAAAEDDAWAFTTKKRKKEKKSKRKSVVDPQEPITEMVGAVAVTAAPEHAQQTELSEGKEPALNELREIETAQPPSAERFGSLEDGQKEERVVEPVEDTWGFPTKKDKKDKKKKRQSTIDEYSSAPSAPVTPSERTQLDKDVIVPVEGLARVASSEENKASEPEGFAVAANTAPLAQIAEDDFSSTGKKKSKKDKKRKKTLLSWSEENDNSTDQPTETSTPANEPELGISNEHDLALHRPDDLATGLEMTSVGLGPPQIVDPTAVLESSIPKAQDYSNIAGDPILESAISDTRDLETGGYADPAEGDGQWDISTAKKSKKGKKGKKNVMESAFAADEDRRQDFDLQEESQKRSLSIPGAFEDETKPGLQLREVLDVEETKEEQNAPLMTEEPETNTNVTNYQPSHLESDDMYPTGPFSEHALPEDHIRDRATSDMVGLGIATVATQAATPGAEFERSVPSDDAPLSDHEAQYEPQRDSLLEARHEPEDETERETEHEVQRDARHYARHEQAIQDHDAQHERDSLPSNAGLELPPVPDAPKERPLHSTWSFANLKQDTIQEPVNRDSGIQVSDLPLVEVGHLHLNARDSGYVPSPIAPASRELSAYEGDTQGILARPRRPLSPTSSSEDLRQKSHKQSTRSHQSKVTREIDDVALPQPEGRGSYQDQSEMLARGHPSPVDSTTKDRSSALFNSSPSNRTDTYGVTPGLDTQHIQTPITHLHRSPSVHGHRSHEDLRPVTPDHSPTRHLRQTSDILSSEPRQEASSQPHRSIFGPFPAGDEHDRGLSPPRTPLQTIHEHVPDASPLNRRRRPLSDVGSPDRGHKSVQRSSAPALGELDGRLDSERTVDALHPQTPTGYRDAVESAQEPHSTATGDYTRAFGEGGGLAGVAGAAATAAIAAEALRPTSRDTRSGVDAKSLGKSKSRSTSSKQLRRSQTSLDNIASSSTHDPGREKGKTAARDMADIYNGFGESPGTPMSPTRPASVRSRRSMQQLTDLEARLDQLASENRLLATAKLNAEQQLQDLHFVQSQTEHASQETLELREAELRDKDEAIAKMREALDMMQKEVSRLTEINEGLVATHEELRSTHEQRYSRLEEQHAETQDQWQDSSRELEDLRTKHAELSTGMEEIVRHELDARLAAKDTEIQRLYDELEDAKTKIRELQRQILAGQGGDLTVTRDEDYFDNACQQLCQHVQQWVLRFSKFSDTRVCRLTSEVRDEKVVDRFDNAILDGSDVDTYLGDRVKRRDVFMSVVMTMIWEYIFTRYLFGMDREQRQKLKLLEKNLSEVGPPSAVHKWRAMTLTLLSKRESFQGQRASDTEAVVQEIYATLARFLPPPQHLQNQIQESLRNVMKAAVDLSIEMRTQRAEYIMLPPLQPEYDTNGDLARQVYFNAALMNERSGETSSNDELESQQAVVRMVLFPLVVKKGSDSGEGEEEIVVCPAQVLVARSGKDKKISRVVSGDRMSIDQANRSVQSFNAPSVLDPTNVI